MNIFINKLKENDSMAENAIIRILKQKGMTELDVSDDENYDAVHAYAYDDDCHGATNETIIKVKINKWNRICLVTDSNRELDCMDIHEGTMPYIYGAVAWRLTQIPDVVCK